MKKQPFHVLVMALWVVVLRWWRGEIELVGETVDRLTSVLNRDAVVSRLEIMMQSRRRGTFSIAFIDLRGLKAINDTYGHHVGDTYLQAFANACQTFLRREGDMIGRIGGDEFLIVAPESRHDMNVLMTRLVSTIGERFLFSYGVAGCEEESDVDGLIGLADQRMYASRQGSEYRMSEEALNCARQFAASLQVDA